MEKSVTERVVVVTGASAGVGRAVARKFAARGDRVALLARGERGLDGAAHDIKDAGGVALPIALDVADYQAVEQAAPQVEQALGPIDVWVNNAMTSVFARFEDMSPEEFQRVNDVTYMGYVHGTKAALTCMRDRDRWGDRAGGLRAGLSGDSAAVGLLRRQARDSGVHRVVTLRAAARPVGHPRHDGAVTGDEHPTVRLGVVAAAAAIAAGATDLSAGGRRRCGRVCRRPPPAARVLGGQFHGGDVDRRQIRTRTIGPLPGAQRVRLAAD